MQIQELIFPHLGQIEGSQNPRAGKLVTSIKRNVTDYEHQVPLWWTVNYSQPWKDEIKCNQLDFDRGLKVQTESRNLNPVLNGSTQWECLRSRTVLELELRQLWTNLLSRDNSAQKLGKPMFSSFTLWFSDEERVDPFLCEKMKSKTKIEKGEQGRGKRAETNLLIWNRNWCVLKLERESESEIKVLCSWREKVKVEKRTKWRKGRPGLLFGLILAHLCCGEWKVTILHRQNSYYHVFSYAGQRKRWQL